MDMLFINKKGRADGYKGPVLGKGYLIDAGSRRFPDTNKGKTQYQAQG